MDNDMKGVVVLTMSVAAMVVLMAAEQGVVDAELVTEWGVVDAKLAVEWGVVDAELAVDAEVVGDIGGGCSDCWGWCTDGG